MKKGLWIGKYVVLGVLFVTLFTWATMLLWNWLVPVLFAGPPINFWQTLGLLILSKILFSGIGKGGHHRGGHWGRHDYWKGKLSGMTPEERESFKNKLKEKWCYRESDASGKESGTSNV